MGKLTLMAIVAHPDDEAFGTGGTLAKYAAEGVDVHLVTATRGEAGVSRAPEVASSTNMPFVREQELRRSCATLGIHPPHFLDYVDGHLTIVNQGQAVSKVVRLIRALKPQVVLTFGPDGIYGHYDHIAVHHWATIAVRLAADPAWFADQLRDGYALHQVNKLYYRALTQDQLEARLRAGQIGAMMDGVPFPFVARKPQEITTIIDVSAYVDVKLQAIRCHLTQVGHDSPYFTSPEEITAQPWMRSEALVLAESTVGWPQSLETDLFAGLR